MSEVFVEVLLDQNLAKPLDYQVPKDWKVEVGMRVEVPLKSTIKKGTISKIKNHTQWKTVKSISRLISQETEISEPLWKLASWMARYYFTPLQRVMKCFIPPSLRKEVKQKTQVFLKIGKTQSETIKAIQTLRLKTPAQAEALEQILNSGKGVWLKELSVSKSVIDALVKKKWISAQNVAISDELLLEEEFFPTLPKKLNEEQQSCLDAIEKTVNKNEFAAHLIYGVTGSGKTEVYMQAIQKVLEQNKSAIILVPEISLTSQTIERFKARFSEKIAILHHKKSLGERSSAWDSLKKGEAKLVIGARSAIFSPAKNLGLIIVDEEHDSSYKQSDEIPCYNGRDVAVMRGHIEKCPVLLGSATPSIESRYNAEVGKYTLHTLSARATSANLPNVQIIDMKQAFDRAGGFTHFSDELLQAIKKRLAAGEQTLLFLNRRGYHRSQICSRCRNIVKCPHCDLSLTFHKEISLLQCHLCDFKMQPPRHCSQCSSSDTLQFKGFGTEHVERSLHAIFPDIRTLRMDRDTTQKKNSHEDLFKQFRAYKADVLIGTQMIAKGFHFPAVTLVGVLNTDATLSIPDFRSQEQVFQLLTQVAGRSGRAELAGEVIIQTFLPDHATIKLAAKQDYDAFYRGELEERKMFGFPPFCHLVKLLFSDPDPDIAKAQAEKGHETLKALLPSTAQLLPVAPAGHPKIKDQYRFHILIKTHKIFEIESAIKEVSDCLRIDVDPLSTFF